LKESPFFCQPDERCSRILQPPDDENELIALLQEFCRLRRAQVEVYFDGAPPGFATVRKVGGTVTVRFVRQGASADSAIEARLRQLEKKARNWTVVSSDGRVQRAAQAAHAGTLTSEKFALEISRARTAATSRLKKEATLGPEEVEEWLKEFGQKRGGER
jgi:predicted RNA-binding protein with PIN domain